MMTAMNNNPSVFYACLSKMKWIECNEGKKKRKVQHYAVASENKISLKGCYNLLMKIPYFSNKWGQPHTWCHGVWTCFNECLNPDDEYLNEFLYDIPRDTSLYLGHYKQG